MNQSPATPECWLIDLVQSEETVRRLSACLSEDENQRAAAFATAALRSRWILARAGLRVLLGRALGIPPHEVKLGLNEFGKPVLSPDPELLSFNLSHTDSHAACVLSRESPVGVDLEHWHRGRVLLSCRKAFCHQTECDFGSSAANLIRLWCAKEAALKAEGLGFQIEPNQVRVTSWEHPPVQAILPDAPNRPWQIVFPELPESKLLCLAVALPLGSRAPVLKHLDWEQL